MKAVLGSLLCYVLMASQCFALKGGPPYPGGSASIVGTYAGVLQPAFDPTDPFSSNSLGFFTLGIPSTGTSTGSFLIFTRGRVFGGTIQGVSDPHQAKISALLSATFDYTLTEPDGIGGVRSTQVAASVTGSLNAKVTVPQSGLATSSALLRGNAVAFISNGFVNKNGPPIIDATLSLEVAGFRQSTAAPSTTGTITPPTG